LAENTYDNGSPGHAGLFLVQLALLLSLASSGGFKRGLHSQGSSLGLLLVAPLCQRNPLPYVQLLVLSMPPANHLWACKEYRLTQELGTEDCSRNTCIQLKLQKLIKRSKKLAGACSTTAT